MKKKILIADDDKNICEVLRIWLEQEGYEIFLAYDGARTLKITQENKPDLILLDIMMPYVNGFHICQELTSSPDYSPKIVLITARGEERDKLIGQGVGADLYITKPFNPEEVVIKVNQLLRPSK